MSDSWANRYPPIMNVSMVSEMLGLSEQKVREFARTGRIPARRLPGSNRWRFDRDEIVGWWDSLAADRSDEEGATVRDLDTPVE